jgi:serine/threonine protein kinase
MGLATGTKLGPYEIQSPLGAGGMGEVYRARDTRLERTVAIKILPAQFSSDPVRKQRFELEAKTISSLNHPHICTLHDVGHQDGMDFLVMECVEGETLAKRFEKGPLPIEQVLKFGAQRGAGAFHIERSRWSTRLSLRCNRRRPEIHRCARYGAHEHGPTHSCGQLASGVEEEMSLAAGSKLGPYEIAGPLGSGGMGEVYRERDTRLERDE